MEINYMIVVPIVLIVLLFVGWLIFKNFRDEKKFEKDTIDSEIKPDKHDD